MALAQQFSFIDRQTNVPVVDISTITGTDILNTIDNALKDIPLSLSDFEKSIKERIDKLDINKHISSLVNDLSAGASSPLDAAMSMVLGDGPPFSLSNIAGAVCDAINSIPNMLSSAVNSVAGSAMRAANKALGPVIDTSIATSSDLDTFLGKLLPSGVSSSFLRSLSGRCKARIGSIGSIGVPWGDACGSKGACGKSSVTGILNSVSRNKFNPDTKNYTAAITGIVGISSLAYDDGLCGAFGTLIDATPGLTPPMIARAGAGVIAAVAPKGNIQAVADVSKRVQGLNVSTMIPNSIDTLMGNIPLSAERTSKGKAVSGMAGLELLDENWNKSKEDPSIYFYHESTTRSPGGVTMYRPDVIDGCVRDVDSFSNNNNYAELAYSLGTAGLSSSMNWNAI